MSQSTSTPHDPFASLPNFFILGAAKAGTTSLAAYLVQHPDIFIPSCKETHFFNQDQDYNRGIDFYWQEYYQQAGEFALRGDATPAYLRKPAPVAARLASTYQTSNGDQLKFIIILRNPVERAWSHYLHRLRNLAETESFERALELEDERVREGMTWCGYYRDGLYAQQIEAWLRHFRKEQFLFLLTEDLATSPQKTLQHCCQFLGVSGDFVFQTDNRENTATTHRSKSVAQFIKRTHRIKSFTKRLVPARIRQSLKQKLFELNQKPYDQKPRMAPENAAALRELYQNDVRRLEKIIDRDLTSWLEPPQHAARDRMRAKR